MMAEFDLEAAAQQLLESQRDRRAGPQLSQRFEGFDLDKAYAVQERYIAMRVAEGRSILGYKVGMTSRTMQIYSGLDEPDYGVLLDDMFYETGADIDASAFIIPRVEVELAFVLGKPLASDRVSAFDVLNATDCVLPALEIIDHRVPRIDQAITDTIADNGASGALVLGSRPIRPWDVDLRWVSALCFRNGMIEETGVSAAVLNHPAASVAWLARKFHSHGVSLAAGDTILSGSFTRPVEARPGDTFHADFGALGAVTCNFH
jgi:2-oxo-hept-3-ene-1,7-dioate hydratase